MRFAQKFGGYFGMESFASYPEPTSMGMAPGALDNANTEKVRELEITTFFSNVSLEIQKITIDSGNLLDNTATSDKLPLLISRLFRKCSRIGRIELRMNIDQAKNEIDVVKNSLSGVLLRRVTFSGLRGSCLKFCSPEY